MVEETPAGWLRISAVDPPQALDLWNTLGNMNVNLLISLEIVTPSPFPHPRGTLCTSISRRKPTRKLTHQGTASSTLEVDPNWARGDADDSLLSVLSSSSCK